MVPPGLVGLDHVDEVGERLLLRHRDGLQVAREELRQLRLVKAGPGGDLEVFLVPPEGVHLQLEQVDVLPVTGLGGHGLAGLLAIPPLPLRSHRLYEGLVVLTDVHVVGRGVQLQLELPLGNSALDLLAVGGVTGGPVAGLALLHQTTKFTLTPSTSSDTGQEGKREARGSVKHMGGTFGYGERISI